MVLPTWRGNPEPTRMCTTIRSSTQVVMCRRERPIRPCQQPTIHHSTRIRQSRSETYWSTTSVIEVHTAFTTCASWIQTPLLTRKFSREIFPYCRKGEKLRYLEVCLHKKCHLSPFIISADFVLSMGAEVTLNLLSRRLNTKWKQPYSRTCGYFKIRVAITLVHATHCCI